MVRCSCDFNDFTGTVPSKVKERMQNFMQSHKIVEIILENCEIKENRDSKFRKL